jgi:hypothetical protein
MILIALVAVGLRVPSWLGQVRLRGPEWWETYWREKPIRDAWNGPVSIRVTSQDSLGSVLTLFKAATARPRLKHGLWIYVDPGGLRDSGRTLDSPLGIDVDAEGRPAREFLGLVLKPLGLVCRLQDGAVWVTSGKSLDEPIYYGDHGEVFCSHGQWVQFLR